MHTSPEGNGIIEKFLCVEQFPRRWLCAPAFHECNDVNGENSAREQQPEGEGRDEDPLAIDLLVERVLHLDQLLHLSLRSARCAPHYTSESVNKSSPLPRDVQTRNKIK